MSTPDRSIKIAITSRDWNRTRCLMNDGQVVDVIHPAGSTEEFINGSAVAAADDGGGVYVQSSVLVAGKVDINAYQSLAESSN